MPEFTGLPKDYFDFFNELKDNNNREWFMDNKARFRQSVQEPLAGFVEAIAPPLKKISKYMVADPRLNGGSVFRIYKDVRFSKDKTPYKTHGAVQFRHSYGKDAHAPGFYVHLATDEVMRGGGVWMPPSTVLLQIREAIRDKAGVFKRAALSKKVESRFGDLRGESLKRPPRGFEADDPMIDYIKRKSFFLMEGVKPGAARKADFVDGVVASFNDAKPLMKFLCESIDVPF